MERDNLRGVDVCLRGESCVALCGAAVSTQFTSSAFHFWLSRLPWCEARLNVLKQQAADFFQMMDALVKTYRELSCHAPVLCPRCLSLSSSSVPCASSFSMHPLRLYPDLYTGNLCDLKGSMTILESSMATS